jgi:hypothetical protein
MDPKFLRNQKRAKKQVNTKTPTHNKQRHEFAKVLTKRKVLKKKITIPYTLLSRGAGILKSATFIEFYRGSELGH